MYLEVIAHLCLCCSLWSDYRKATYRKLTVAFNNIHRRMHGLPWRCSACVMYANYDLPNIDTIIQFNSIQFNSIVYCRQKVHIQVHIYINK